MKTFLLSFTFSFWVLTALCQTSVSKFIKKGDMPVANFSCAITWENKIYLFGGGDSGNIVRAYSPSTNTWEIKKSYPKKVVQYCGFNLSGDTIFMVVRPVHWDSSLPDGLWDYDHPKHTIAAYLLKTDEWKLIDSTLLNTNDPAVTFVGRNIFLIGGFFIKNTDYINSDSVKQYNLDTKKWINKPKLPTPRHASTAFSDNSKIYVFGGIDFLTGIPNCVQIFDTLTNTWLRKTIGVENFASSKGTRLKDIIYMPYGNLTNQLNYAGIFMYNLKTGESVNDSHISLNRLGMVLGSYEDTIYVFGGSCNGTTYKNVYQYIPENKPTGINETNKVYLPGIYPNPSRSGVFNISNEMWESYQIFNLKGEEIQKGSKSNTIYFSEKGVYLIRLYLKNGEILYSKLIFN